MFGEQKVMSGDVGDWFVCGGILVWRFLLFRMLRCSKWVIKLVTLGSGAWFLYQVGWWALKSPHIKRFGRFVIVVRLGE